MSKCLSGVHGIARSTVNENHKRNIRLFSYDYDYFLFFFFFLFIILRYYK